MEKLSPEAIAKHLAEFEGWSLVGDKLQRTFAFDDFVGAMAFVNRIADLAERQQHHPDVLIRYNKVTLTLSTHDASGITEKDFALAREADAGVLA